MGRQKIKCFFVEPLFKNLKTLYMLLVSAASRIRMLTLVLMIMLVQFASAGVPGDFKKPVVQKSIVGYNNVYTIEWPAWLQACDSLNRILSGPITAGNVSCRWQPAYADWLQHVDKGAVDEFMRGYFFISANPVYPTRNPNIRLYQAYESITFDIGFETQVGDEFTAEIVSPGLQVPGPSNNTGSTNSDMNWIIGRSFDENGNVISEGKQFFDNSGQLLQAQSKVKYISNGTTTITHVFASQPVRDVLGREAITTMAAPIDNSEFIYKPDFVRNSNGTAYDFYNFDKYTGGDKTNNPDPVGGQNVPGTLGWYYSSNNSWEPYTPTTNYPYSRQSYFSDGTGATKKTAGTGEPFIMGSGHEVSSIKTPVINELDHYLQVRNKFFSAAELGTAPATLKFEAVQIVAGDANGRIAVGIQDRNGKTLMVARPGSDLAVTNTATIKAGEIFYFRTFATGNVTISATTYELYNMETDQQLNIGTAGSLGAGYYKLVNTGANTGTNTNTGANDITVTYGNSYTDVSYSFYNQLGQLIATIAPEGVKKLYNNGFNNYTVKSDVPFITLYEYDVQGRLIKSSSEEKGVSELVYRSDGKIRFSQNPEQKNDHRYSYINYDQQGRIIEAGEYLPGTGGIAFNSDLIATVNPMRDILEDVSATGGLINGTKKDVIMTQYDIADNSHGQNNRNGQPYLQDPAYLGNVVSMTKKYSSIVNNTPASADLTSSTWFNYDEESKVVWKIEFVQGAGYKTTDFTYDALGRLVKKAYQDAVDAERFIHYYEYDKATQKLFRVYTSKTNNATDKILQATYIYYLHGPLKRIELGGDVQGLDYTYTLQGALKAINNSDKTKDPGNDGGNGIEADAFGMVLDYFAGDYNNTRISGIQPIKGVSSASVGTDGYAGSIKAMTWFSRKPASVVGSVPGIEAPTTYLYEYDPKYQFTESSWYTDPLNTFTATGFNKEKVKDPNTNLPAYDANGNILRLQRTSATGTLDKRFTYNYFNTITNTGSNTNYNSNRLQSVMDDASGTPTTYAKYTYDMLGRVAIEEKGNGAIVSYIKYDVTGKVIMVSRKPDFTQRVVEFVYNESGKRIVKKSYNALNQLADVTYYVGDVIYTQTVTNGTYGNIVAQEYGVQGAGSRLGTYYRPSDVYAYELNDHLGNVRAVVARNTGTFEVRMYTDYYPYGKAIRGNPQSYRHGYQGQYAEKDNETAWHAFELRMYDTEIGRWLQHDPKGEFWSPYVGMGNDPVKSTDPDGGSSDDVIFRGKDKKEIRVVAPGDDIIVDVPFDLKENKTFNFNFSSNVNILERLAIGYTVSASVNMGVYYGGTYSGELTYVKYTNNEYGNYWYVYGGGSGALTGGNQINIGASLGASVFVAVNTQVHPDYNPDNFSGETDFYGIGADYKEIVGGGVSAQFFTMSSGWSGISVGASIGVGAGYNAGSGFRGKSYSVLFNNIKKTRERGFWDRVGNETLTLPQALTQYYLKKSNFSNPSR